MKRTIEAWREWLSTNEVTDEILAELLTDTRQGVRQLGKRYQMQQEKEKAEQERLNRMWKYEKQFWQNGQVLIAGVDEAGRGPLAGPVVAAAVILPQDFDVTGLNDSKQVTATDRDILRKRIEQTAIGVGVGIVDVAFIDQYNILQATYQAMRIAISQLPEKPDQLLLDAVKLPKVPIPQQSLIKGDSLSHSIAAASIIAKTTRDKWMMDIHKHYPQYGFDQHMGYGVPAHLEMLKKYGPSPIHRRSFSPVRAVLGESS
ncbi:ribonuclease HII [Shimazuella sp. AN120528]|uniref:ribonuclease HII n=1 Tax=Shimazuella soli TaxID=1892854 RepID=UPI001F10F0E2|nr:ribonuclease HII [Shimazuella soli]MCH5584985.1 ribonuclease HII [Shimazuella soli]